MSTVTREQALAFVEALVPMTFLNEIGEVPVHADSRVHLEAVLGKGNIPLTWELKHLLEDAALIRSHRDSGNDAWVKANADLDAREAKRDAFLDYLQGVVDALRPPKEVA